MDFTQLGQYGIAAVALGLLGYALKLFHDSYQQNTEALHQLTTVMEKQAVREQMFMDMIYPIAKDTNERVRRMEEKM
jgi:cell shape-determining protein MreD